MKVKELIEQLKLFDGDAEVYVAGDDRDCEINHVGKDRHGDVTIS